MRVVWPIVKTFIVVLKVWIRLAKRALQRFFAFLRWLDRRVPDDTDAQ